MHSGDKPPASPSTSSSSADAALIDTKYPQLSESMGFPLPPSPFAGIGSFSSATISVESKIEHLADKIASFPVSSSSPGDESSSVSREASAIPRPVEALQGTPIPPFLSKTYELVDDSALDPIISWGLTGESFVVWDPVEFSRAVLPRRFKHNNFSSFVRQLNTYGFRKIGTDRWEFANEDFLRGKRALLKHINRRRSSQVQIGAQVDCSDGMGKHGEESEVQKLIRERDLMMQEVVQLRQERFLTVQKMDALNQRMHSAEVRWRQMVSFLAKVLQNPVFVGHLKQLKEQNKTASTRVRRKFLKQQQQQQQHSSSAVPDKPMDHQIVKYKSGFWDASALDSLLPEIESGESSGPLLPVFEPSEGKQLPDHLLQDVDKLGLDTCGQEFFGASDESKGFKGKNILSSLMEADFGGSDCFMALPDDVTPEEIVPENIPPKGLTVSGPDSTTFASKGKDIVSLETDNIAADSGAGTEYLETFAEDISQERMFPDAIVPASDCVGEEGIWNIGLDAGGSSLSPGYAVWDSLGHYHAQEMESAAGSCSLWDLGLHNLEEDLDIDKYVRGESFLPEHKDDSGQQNEDSPRDL